MTYFHPTPSLTLAMSYSTSQANKDEEAMPQRMFLGENQDLINPSIDITGSKQVPPLVATPHARTLIPWDEIRTHENLQAC